MSFKPKYVHSPCGVPPYEGPFPYTFQNRFALDFGLTYKRYNSVTLYYLQPRYVLVTVQRHRVSFAYGHHELCARSGPRIVYRGVQLHLLRAVWWYAWRYRCTGRW